MLRSISQISLKPSFHLVNQTLSAIKYTPLQSFSSTTTESEENASRPGQHKTPVTDHLWSLRKTIIKQNKEKKLKKQEEKLLQQEAAAESLQAVPVEETSVEYAFSKDASLRETYINPFGTIRIGRVLEDLDALAGNVAFRHCAAGRDPETFMLVTASIDRIRLLHRSNLKDDITLKGYVTWVGSSSMEIHLSACSSWTDQPWLTALFTFVARDRVLTYYTITRIICSPSIYIVYRM